MSKITGTWFFFARDTAFNAASLEGEAASAVPDIKSAFALFMYSSSMSSTLSCRSAILPLYIKILLSVGLSISVNVSPSFSPFWHLEIWEISIPSFSK